MEKEERGLFILSQPWGQGPKLCLPGHQCDWKFSSGDQNFISIRVEHFQPTMLFPVELCEVCYVCGIILYPYATSNVASCDTGTGNMAAWLVTCVYVPCFVVVIRRK